MSELDRSGAKNCFVCGADNESGLRLTFRMDGDICRSEYTPAAHHIGFDNVVHGGLIYSALDDIMANWLFLQGKRAVTGKCEIRYRNPAAPGAQLLLEGRLLSSKRRTAQLSALAINAADQQVIAEATATFVLLETAGL
jgi:acyl-coenzyme A thioesterase PaaI-like protein